MASSSRKRKGKKPIVHPEIDEGNLLPVELQLPTISVQKDKKSGPSISVEERDAVAEYSTKFGLFMESRWAPSRIRSENALVGLIPC
ncbi:hypothetical protein R1flu_015129 [Riccia fluitans]|uniref:Uncharacterized protein n=1 Tax=Riccia fluitans TaxID=41844 RepID=A0ABD1YIF3_9MARC